MLLIYVEVENVLDWMNLLAIEEKPSEPWRPQHHYQLKNIKGEGLI